MNRLHHAKLIISVALSTLVLAGCGGGGSDRSPEAFTKCTASGVHSADAPGSYRLFPLLAGSMNVDSVPASVRFTVSGRDNKGNSVSGTHGEYIDGVVHDDTSTPAREYRDLISSTEWTGSGEHPLGIAQYFQFNISDPDAHLPLPHGDVYLYEIRTGPRNVFRNVIVVTGPHLLASFQFALIDYESIPPSASPGERGSLGTYIDGGGEYTLERKWSLENAKDNLAFLSIQSVIYRTADRSTVYEENLSYQINEEGERQCVALYANDSESVFSIRLEGTLEETPANN